MSFCLRCDSCEKIVVRPIIGIPPGWIERRPLFGLVAQHMCPDCQAEFTEWQKKKRASSTKGPEQ